jgi:1-acyl-sn-glycerol-3-phosphate acyltransferase
VNLTFSLVTGVIKRLTRILCRIDDSQFALVPAQGPLILIANHINFLEAPILYTHLQPRPVTGFVKAENWENPATRFLFELWGGIPLNRGEADVEAFRRGLAALKEGYILAIAPEGTRSGHGRLQRGLPGVVLLALRSGAPLLPLVYYGSENYRQEWARLRRPDFYVKVGRPFTLDAGGARVTQDLRQQMVDEIMYKIAELLPPAYRGVYSDMSAASERYLRFPAGPQDR